MSNNSQLTFDDLLVDEADLNEELLAETLYEYIRIEKQSGNIVPKSSFKRLTAKQKTVVILLAQRVLKQLGMTESEWIGPKRISEIGGMNDGTVGRIVRELDTDGLVEDDDGSYRIPMWSFEDAQAFIREEDDEQ